MLDVRQSALVKKYRKEVEAFRTQICEHADEIDPHKELHFSPMSIGFFIAVGVPIEDALRLDPIVRYVFQYWNLPGT